jgi:phage tail-like protein
VSASRRAYRFADDAQWRRCLFDGVERAASANSPLRSYAPYALPPIALGFIEPLAPAVDPYGRITWRNADGALFRWDKDDDEPASGPAPSAVEHAARIVANGDAFWVAGERRDTVECFDQDTLARRMVVEVGPGAVRDLADDGKRGVFVLVDRDCQWRCVHIDCAGHVVGAFPLAALLRPTGFTYLRDAQHIVALDGKGGNASVRWYAVDGSGELAQIVARTLGVCFDAALIAGDTQGRVFIAGTDRERNSVRHHVVILDGEGETIGDIPLDEPATGAASSSGVLIVTTSSAVLMFNVTDAVPDVAPESRFTVVTPMLPSPATPSGPPWLRVETLADLPAGTTMEIVHAATSDAAIVDEWNRTLQDPALSRTRRLAALREREELWGTSVSIRGSADQLKFAGVPLAAPLLDVNDAYVAVAVTLIASSGAPLPSLRRLEMLYPGRTLMDHLPAIYRTTEREPRDFTRALVGVLETTTQDLDARIASMGRHINPHTAKKQWLDYIAGWLGLPWDDALSEAQKAAFIASARILARSRGTRAGLEALLEAIIAESDARYRITDATADHGFAILSSGPACGSYLPAMLAGLAPDAAELGARAVLGRLHLPCAGAVDDGTTRLAGRVQVDLAVSAQQRAQWEPWIRTVLLAMLPATTRLDLRWRARNALADDSADLELLDLTATPALGTDAVMGEFVLSDGPAVLSRLGTDVGARLQ